MCMHPFSSKKNCCLVCSLAVSFDFDISQILVSLLFLFGETPSFHTNLPTSANDSS